MEEKRQFTYSISEDIQNRWSPRAFSSAPVPREEIMAILEAARYAPSCFNEQPWRFVVADRADTLAKMREVLNEGNRQWASVAPVLLLFVAKKTFTGNGKENDWHLFDTGTAWGFLALEAERRGLITHAMAGFDKEKARSVWEIPADYVPVTMVAIGKMGDKTQLPAALQERERPGLRRSLQETVFWHEMG